MLRSTVIAICILGVSQASADVVLGPYGAVVARFVDADDGLVDYSGLKANREQIDTACAMFAETTQAQYAAWNERDRMVFWLNAYNAFTLKLIVDNYPIKPSTGKTRYPANSIRQIPGAWEHVKFKAMGRDVTLDEIEHKILRVEFHDPRIHMALVCGAMSCPKLSYYEGDALDAELDYQARAFLSDLRKFHIDREANEVWVSPIFEWFVDDFLPDATQKYPRYEAQQKSLAAFASKYVSREDAAYLQSGKYVVKYYEYDWTLNEQPKR